MAAGAIGVVITGSGLTLEAIRIVNGSAGLELLEVVPARTLDPAATADDEASPTTTTGEPAPTSPAVASSGRRPAPIKVTRTRPRGPRPTGTVAGPTSATPSAVRSPSVTRPASGTPSVPDGSRTATAGPTPTAPPGTPSESPPPTTGATTSP